MKRKWWLVPAVFVVIGVAWVLASDKARLEPLQAAIGLKPSPPAQPKQKPICSQIIVPAGDCIPQHMANLPPDPGPAGMKTIEGVDTDKDGVRDDVQRFIVENYGHSERAVMALREVAKGAQRQVELGDSVSHDQAKAVVVGVVDKAVTCYSRSVDDSLRFSNALQQVVIEVTNTPERFIRKKKFEVAAGHRVYESPQASLPELCGYDPKQLAN